MLELKSYSKAEMTQMFGTRDTEGLKRKLDRYGVLYNTSGRGDKRFFDIKEIKDPFKVYCITELGFDGATDFHKLRNFLYGFLNDDEFMAMPDEVKENRMRSWERAVSRQTIATYENRLIANNLLFRTTENYIYYFAYKNTQRIVERAEYVKAWQEYFQRKKDGMDSIESIWVMRMDYGGVARKSPIPELNGVYLDKIEYLNELVCQSIEAELEP